MYNFPLVRSKFLKAHASNNMPHPLGVSKDFHMFTRSCFFDPQRGPKLRKKGPCPGTHVSKLGLPSAQKGRKQGPNGTPSGFGRGSKGRELPGHPVCGCTCCCVHAHVDAQLHEDADVDEEEDERAEMFVEMLNKCRHSSRCR